MSGVQQKQEKWYTFSAGMINLLCFFSVSFKKAKFSMKLFLVNFFRLFFLFKTFSFNKKFMHIKNEEKTIKKEKFKDSRCYLCTKINPYASAIN
jgi:phosphotransferase system  glucose/maltose/N-acetylglucosamine-specific IIC component